MPNFYTAVFRNYNSKGKPTTRPAVAFRSKSLTDLRETLRRETSKPISNKEYKWHKINADMYELRKGATLIQKLYILTGIYL